MIKKCPDCKKEMIEQKFYTDLRLEIQTPFISDVKEVKPFICEKCGYVGFWCD